MPHSILMESLRQNRELALRVGQGKAGRTQPHMR